eukprot:6026071-Pyramimonas_sp.AAC.1
MRKISHESAARQLQAEEYCWRTDLEGKDGHGGSPTTRHRESRQQVGTQKFMSSRALLEE